MEILSDLLIDCGKNVQSFILMGKKFLLASKHIKNFCVAFLMVS